MVQIEDGHTKIANELLDAILRFPFSKRELKIVLAVIRKTYGWNKKMDDISLSQIESLTGIFRTHLSKSINDLVSMKVLLKQSGKYGQMLGINKNYSQWRGLPKQSCDQNSNSTVTKTVTEVLPKQSIQKTTPKDTIKRHIPKDFKISERVKLWAEKKGYSRLDDHLENFICQSKARGYKYSDWDSAFMNAIRKNWAGIEKQTSYGQGGI